MIYREETRDLFTVNEEVVKPYCLAHCISADFAMAGGIAVSFNVFFNMKNKLINKYKSLTNQFTVCGPMILPELCYSLQYHSFYIYNLVTKCYVADKPTYEDLKTTLMNMKTHMVSFGKTKLAIPKIGCGIDGLDWKIVSQMIQEVFKDTEIEILVCIQ